MNAHIDIPQDELSVMLVQQTGRVEHAVVKATWNSIRQ